MQKNIITGTVAAASDRSPIVGANVLIKDSNGKMLTMISIYLKKQFHPPASYRIDHFLMAGSRSDKLSYEHQCDERRCDPLDNESDEAENVRGQCPIVGQLVAEK